MSYFPTAVPDDAPSGLKAWIADQLRRVAAEFSNVQSTTVTVAILGVAPLRPRNGMIAYADGVEWDPTGAGAGFYGYEGGAWVKL